VNCVRCHCVSWFASLFSALPRLACLHPSLPALHTYVRYVVSCLLCRACHRCHQPLVSSASPCSNHHPNRHDEYKHNVTFSMRYSVYFTSTNCNIGQAASHPLKGVTASAPALHPRPNLSAPPPQNSSTQQRTQNSKLKTQIRRPEFYRVLRNTNNFFYLGPLHETVRRNVERIGINMAQNNPLLSA
jgi:hypothetical protein